MDCPKCHKPSRIRSSNDTRKGWIERRECKTCGYRFVVEADGTTRTIRMYRQPDIKVEKTTLADWTPRERRARELLAETDLPIPAVAAKSGFGSPEYLAYVFKEELGASPREYRSRVRGH